MLTHPLANDCKNSSSMALSVGKGKVCNYVHGPEDPLFRFSTAYNTLLLGYSEQMLFYSLPGRQQNACTKARIRNPVKRNFHFGFLFYLRLLLHAAQLLHGCRELPTQ